MLVILIFAGRVWTMAYVWMILPTALILARQVEAYPSRPRTWQLGLTCLAVFLLLSKIYGYPILDSLNLWGSLLLAALLVRELVKDALPGGRGAAAKL
jgi:hypothetical protein